MLDYTTKCVVEGTVDPLMPPIVAVGVECGLRVKALLGIRAVDVRESGEIEVPNHKGHSANSVGAPARVRMSLLTTATKERLLRQAKVVKGLGKDPDYVFPPTKLNQ